MSSGMILKMNEGFRGCTKRLRSSRGEGGMDLVPIPEG
jgi:hypothetical protein